MSAINHEKQFSIRIYENDMKINEQVLDDPFIRTLIVPRGWKAAWLVLWGKLKFNINVDGERAAHRVIFGGDYTPHPPGPAQTFGLEAKCSRPQKD